MASNRLKYGIDLGTTNSALVRMERGEGKVVKNDMQGDTTSSAVAFGHRGSTRVGARAYNQLGLDRVRALKQDQDIRNAFVEFKRTMGSEDIYVPSVDPSASYTSEVLSAEVLKELRRYVTDDDVSAAVVTIPAAFKVPQQQATLRAAEMAGIRQCHLLQEPVAAAMAYGLTAENRDGKWLVFDFGGGTFDAALVVIEEGQITVKDTEGDNHLGGKELDDAVVEEIIFKEAAADFDAETFLAGDPRRERRLTDALKRWAEEARIALSFRDSYFVESDLDGIELPDGDAITLDFRLTRERLRPVVEPYYQRSIDKCHTLLARHGLSSSDLDELILVGGPTHSPILRDMLSAQIRQPNTSVDPMTVVAQGAALYAATIPLEAESEGGKRTTESRDLQLRVEYEATSLSATEWVNVQCQDADARGRLEVELQRVGWSSGRHQMDERGALLEVTLEKGRANVFAIQVTDASGNAIVTNPSEITIIQGTRVGGSPLTNHLGLEVELQSGDHVFKPLKGAEQSRPLPVTGISRGLRTPKQLRPGVPTDELLIRIFEGESNAPATNILYSQHFMTLKLSGAQVNQVIPAGSRFDLTLKTDVTSAMPVRVALAFEALDEEFELPIPDGSLPTHTDWIEDELREGRARIVELHQAGHADEGELAGIEEKITQAEGPVFEDAADPDETRKAVNLLQEALRELDHLWSKSQWPRVRDELDEVWADLRKANREEGYADTRREMREWKGKHDQVVQEEDAALARMLIADLRGATFFLKRCEWSNEIVQWARAYFSRIAWKDPTDAREAVNEGVQALLANRPCSEMLDHARRILGLVSEDHAPEDRAPRPPVPISEF
ncbi:MAG: Hsp70 family protein [Gemmatimonadota bacterium]|nr:Hsp70 family protein [Gemmatimonadota bacterium]MDE2872904.1 Hsp70 family protein [Gemmatimonadota bacterium]